MHTARPGPSVPVRDRGLTMRGMFFGVLIFILVGLAYMITIGLLQR
jgi:hypothetical protein